MVNVIKIKSPDTSEWFLSVADVIVHKSRVVAKEKGIDETYAMVQFVIPEFKDNSESVLSWAKNNMKPEDCNLVMLKPPKPLPKEEVMEKGEWYCER